MKTNKQYITPRTAIYSVSNNAHIMDFSIPHPEPGGAPFRDPMDW